MKKKKSGAAGGRAAKVAAGEKLRTHAPGDDLGSLLDDLKRYEQYGDRGGALAAIVLLPTGAVPLDFHPRVVGVPAGTFRLDLRPLYNLLNDDAVRPRASKNRGGLWPLYATVAYMVRHAPKKIDAALWELFLEATEHNLQRKAREEGKPYKARVTEIRKAEEGRMRRRLAQDELEVGVAFAVGVLGYTTRAEVAGELGKSTRTLQRWANRNYEGGWDEVVKKFSTEGGRETKRGD